MLRFLAAVVATASSMQMAAMAQEVAESTAPRAAAEAVLDVVLREDEVLGLDLPALMAMPIVSFTTTTVWTSGPVEFTGVPLAALLEELGAEGEVVSASALNGYHVDLPLDEISEEAPIVAYLKDGEAISRRDNGPLWIVYPYDSNPDYRNELTYARSIWQLVRIEVR